MVHFSFEVSRPVAITVSMIPDLCFASTHRARKNNDCFASTKGLAFPEKNSVDSLLTFLLTLNVFADYASVECKVILGSRVHRQIPQP